MNDDQFTQILRAINDVRDDLKDFKSDMNRRWDANDKRWEQNDNKFGTIQGQISKINETIERRYRDTIKVFEAYENSVENMYQDNKKRIIVLEKRLKVANT